MTSPARDIACAIMQPTYLPWVGYFALMDAVDHFVLLDTVAFSKQSWQQRNRIKTASGESWLTAPVLTKGRSGQRICDVEIDAARKGVRGHMATIAQAYGKAPHYDAYAPGLMAILEDAPPKLSDLSIALIDWLRGALGVTTPVWRASTLAVEDDRIERLVAMCKRFDATRYVSPPGARDYLDTEQDAFERAGVSVRYFAYDHPVYDQRYGDFIPYMSAIDLLFNVGPEALATLRAGASVNEDADAA